LKQLLVTAPNVSAIVLATSASQPQEGIASHHPPQSTGQVRTLSPVHTPSPQHALLQRFPLQGQSPGHERQSSPLPSHIPLPQTVGQSGSVMLSQSGAQHKSLSPHAGQVCVHAALHVPPFSHESVVQTSPSLQSAAVVHARTVQRPPQHAPTEQPLPSPRTTCSQKAPHVPGFAQLSVVHSLPSSQSPSAPQLGVTHTPLQHRTAPPLPSPQSASSSHTGPATSSTRNSGRWPTVAWSREE